MKIKLIAVGSKMPAWVDSGFQQYCKRLPKDFAVKTIEIPLARRSKNQQPEQWKNKEGEQIIKNLHKDDFVIALEIKGKNISTQLLAEKLTQLQISTSSLAFIIGGPDGLSAACLKRADFCWSLSALTLPHPIVRIIFIEAIYRAWSLMNNHPYHRE